MRNPNGYGSVIKLSGARRKPWAARRTIGFNEKNQPKYKYIGYFATRREAIQCLAEYNKNPYDMAYSSATVEEVYQMYCKDDLLKKAEVTRLNYVCTYNKYLSKIGSKKFRELQVLTIQEVINGIKGGQSQRIVKALYKNLEDYALKINATNKAISSAITVKTDEVKRERFPFAEEEINVLWEHTEIPIVREALILIYTGFRITEYLTLKISDMRDGCFCGGIKTQAGKKRLIPIHSRILPLVEEKLKNADSDAFCGYGESKFRTLWNECPYLKDHIIHETRHTFRSRLDESDANKVAIDMMMGHSSGNVGERVYTHKTIDQLKHNIELMN